MKKIIDFIQLIFVSIISGSTAVIPGVSGGTILAIFNLTEELTNSIQSILDNLFHIIKVLTIDSFKLLFYCILSIVNKVRKNSTKNEVINNNIKEIITEIVPILRIIKLPVVIGLGSLIFSIMFSKIIGELIDNAVYFVNFLFIGLITFSLPILWSEANENIEHQGVKLERKLFSYKIIYLIIGFILMLAVLILFPDTSKSGGITEIVINIKFLLIFSIGSFFAGMMAIIPGISGTNIMIMFGIYDEFIFINSNINDFIVLYAIYLIMTIAGIVVSSYVLNFIYKRFRLEFFSLMTGLTAATIFTLNPFENYYIFMQIIIGFIIAFLLIKFLTNKN